MPEIKILDTDQVKDVNGILQNHILQGGKLELVVRRDGTHVLDLVVDEPETE